MSLESLLSNWAPPLLAAQIDLVPATFSERASAKKLVFIAAPWSGTSQLAFRKFCQVLADSLGPIPPILVIEEESLPIAELSLPATIPIKGVGTVVMFYRDQIVGSACGQDLAHLRYQLEFFLQAVEAG